MDFAEALRQFLPEIDGFKRCDRIKPTLREDPFRHTALQNRAAPLCDGVRIDLLGFLHADGRVVDALHNSMRTLFQHSLDVCPAAAAAIQHLGVRHDVQKPKSPSRHRTVTEIHQADHELSAKPLRLAGVLPKGHIVTPPSSHIPHRSAGRTLSTRRFFALSSRFPAENSGIPRSSTCCKAENPPAS